VVGSPRGHGALLLDVARLTGLYGPPCNFEDLRNTCLSLGPPARGLSGKVAGRPGRDLLASPTGCPGAGMETLRMALMDGLSNKNSAYIHFSEQLEPAVDPQDSDVVACEAVFEPASLDQARVEISGDRQWLCCGTA
jgi:hypothetical protein